MLVLKTGVNNTVQLGPFIDTDGYTPLTGLTITAGEVWLSKQGATGWTAKNSGGLTHSAGGYYYGTFDSTDTNTVGRLQVYVKDTGDDHLPVYHEFMVLPANIADSWYLGTDTLQVDVTQIAGDTTAATNLYRAANGIVVGQAATGTLSTTQMTTGLSEATDDHYNGRIVVWVSGVLAGQAATITNYVGSSKMIEYSAGITEAPSNGDYFVIV